MVFSSLIFLSFFLPVVLCIYQFLAKKFQNYFLLVMSLFFYWWGEPGYIWVILLSIIFTHVGGYYAANAATERGRRTSVAIGVALNLSLLLYFKYAGFLLQWAVSLKVLLPIGISFYIFQGISYIIDSYRKDYEPQANILNTALYISMFPQLVAGPIVRYASIAPELQSRTVTLQKYTDGLARFCFGLAKKVLIANPAGQIADSVFALPVNELTLPIAWLGALAYTIQIYFDFSGYSDMAIGLGRIFGYSFPENFNYPYIAKSITEFWRRWHISLSSWFRDYVYIPLGGNRKGRVRTNVNLIIVFLLTGFWHGAAWTFIFWGMWHGLFLMLEKYLALKVKKSAPAVLKWLYTFMVVVFGWVLFRSENISQALHYMRTMLDISNIEIEMFFLSYMGASTLVLFIASALLSTGLFKNYGSLKFFGKITAIFLLALSYTMLASSTYNPFIYFRF